MRRIIHSVAAVAIGLGTLAGASALTVVTAPVAAACDMMAGQLCDNTQSTIGQKPTPPPAPDPKTCSNGSCAGDGNVGTYTTTRTYGGSAWFWEASKVIVTVPPLINLNYDNMYTFNNCALPKGYPVTEANIGSGASYTIKVARYATFSQQHTLVVMNGLSTWVDSPEVVEWWGSCTPFTIPSWQQVPLTVTGKMRVQGPFDFDASAMKPVSAGGTLTRDSDGDGVPSVDGKVLTGISPLGIKILNRLGKNPNDPSNYDILKTAAGLATPKEAYDIAIKTGDPLAYLTNTDEALTTRGRYAALQWRWRDIANGAVFSQFPDQAANYAPALYAQMGSKYFPATSNLYPMFIKSVTGPTLARDLQRFKITCTTAAKANGRMAYDLVNGPTPSDFTALDGSWASGMPSAVASGEWNDSADTYTHMCGAAPPEGVIRTDDMLQCANYAGTPVVVDNKSAAPIRTVSQVVDGDVQGVEWQPTADGVGEYRIGSAADPVHVEWDRARINTRSGQNINVAGRDVVWDYTYRIAEWSSPKLKKTVTGDVNHPTQPYHGWVDSTADTVSAGEIPLTQKWEPDKFYNYDTKPYTFITKAYTFHTVTTYQPRQVTTETYSYYGQTGWRYWWGTGGADCGRWSNGDPWCREPTYGWQTGTRTVVAPPPAGCYDDGSQYVCPVQVKDSPAAGYTDNGVQWQKKVVPPSGYHDDGTQYVSDQPVNWTGQSGGIAFNEWRKFPSQKGLSDCTVKVSGETYTLKCGDNVTDQTRAAYFRYFQSSTAGSQGWQVVPWARVTATLDVSYTKTTGFNVNGDGSFTPVQTTVTEPMRESYACPSAPFRAVIERVVS